MTAPWEIVVLGVGGAAYTIPFQRAGQADPERVGDLARAYAGNQYSSIRAEFMVVPLVSAPVTSTQYAQVKALFALGAQVPCQAGSAGNVFEGVTSVVTCTGKVTGEMIPGLVDSGKPMWTINLTLTEVGTALSGAPVTSQFLLTSVDSPDSTNPVVFVSTPAGSYPGDAATSYGLLTGTTVPTGGSLNPTTPDRAWLSVPLKAGYITGIPYVQVEVAMSGVYSGTTVWARMDVMAKIYQVRGVGGATVVAGPFSTNYVGVSLGGNTAILSCTSRVVLSLQSGDRMLVELYPRLQLQPATADNGQRQTVFYGAVPGPHPLPLLVVGGLVEAL